MSKDLDKALNDLAVHLAELSVKQGEGAPSTSEKIDALKTLTGYRAMVNKIKPENDDDEGEEFNFANAGRDIKEAENGAPEVRSGRRRHDG